MTTRKPLNEGNTRNVQKGNVANPRSQPKVTPNAPPPAPTPPSVSEQNSNNGINSSGSKS